jgi:oligoendopeptidase F
MRSDRAHLRTRATGGLDYKGYNIAVHELGHTVEQVFSLNEVGYYFLSGVPNTAFTEAFAFTFQARDLGLLGVSQPDPQAEALKTLDTFWSTYEISGVSLVDMRIWRWMYEHPKADPSQLQEAVIRIAKEVWNRYFFPVFGMRDTPILAIYSHMIDSSMYLPDYALGHIINFQIESYLKERNLAVEMERMCRQGALTPSLWMERAVGAPISTEPLLSATEAALAESALYR